MRVRYPGSCMCGGHWHRCARPCVSVCVRQVCLSFSHALPAQSSKKSTQRALMYRTGISRKKIRASNFLNTPSKDQFFSSALVPIKQLAVFEPQPPSDRSSKVSRYLKCDSRENQRESFNNCENLVLVFKNCAIL